MAPFKAPSAAPGLQLRGQGPTWPNGRGNPLLPSLDRPTCTFALTAVVDVDAIGARSASEQGLRAAADGMTALKGAVRERARTAVTGRVDRVKAEGNR